MLSLISTRKNKDDVFPLIIPSQRNESYPLLCLFFSKGAFLMCSSPQEEMESSKHWDIQPSDAAWVSVVSAPVLMSTAGTEGSVWTQARLCSE